MTIRENILSILRFGSYDRFPMVAFGYWDETVKKWVGEGHIPQEDADAYYATGDNGDGDKAIMKRLGFDYNWSTTFPAQFSLFPAFEEALLEEKPDGSRIIRDNAGLICMVKPGVISIPAEVGTTLTGREAWEELYLPKFRWSEERVDIDRIKTISAPEDREIPAGLYCGSLMGTMRNLLGVEALSYLYADDEELFEEIAYTFADIAYRCVKKSLESGAVFDYAHFWEDICFKTGPLVHPEVFARVAGPGYKKITALLAEYGIDIVSLDCDGMIGHLIPTWINNGVNTMFPIEVGTWHASIAPWREKYGNVIKGVGGMDKRVFAYDYAAVDREVERLLPLVKLGGYIPCPDHRIAPDAKFENVQYYCERMRKALG